MTFNSHFYTKILPRIFDSNKTNIKSHLFGQKLKVILYTVQWVQKAYAARKVYAEKLV
jgi:hypothetical protein